MSRSGGVRVLTGKHGCGERAKLVAVIQRGPAGPIGPGRGAPGLEYVGQQANIAVAVPAGTWTVLGQAAASDLGAAQIDFTCKREHQNTQFDRIYQSVASGSNVTLSPIATTATTGTSTVLTLLCTSTSAQTDIGSMNLVAIPAAALN